MQCSQSYALALRWSSSQLVLAKARSGFGGHLTHARTVLTSSKHETPSSSSQPQTLLKTQEAPREWTVVDRQLRDIRPGDLKATLDAHRRSNEEKLITWVVKDYPEKQPNGLQAEEPEKADTADPSTGDDTSKHVAIRFYSPQAHQVKQVATDKMKRARLAASTKGVGNYIRAAPYREAAGQPFWPGTDMDSTGPAARRDCLAKNMKELTNWLCLTPDEKEYRDLQAIVLMKDIAAIDSTLVFHIFGSQTTGLASPMSDVDIAFDVDSLSEKVEGRGPSTGMGRIVNRKLVFTKLSSIAKRLENDFMQIELLRKTRYPLVKAKHEGSGVKFQIVRSLGDRSHHAYVQSYLAEYPHLRDIFNLIDTALKARALRDVLFGGLGTYSLLMMIVASLKHGKRSRRDDLVDTLLHVLRFYAEFDSKAYGLSVDPPLKFEKLDGNAVQSLKTKRLLSEDPMLAARHRIGTIDPDQPWLLCLQDPADPINDLCQKSYAFLDIQATFAELLRHTEKYLSSTGGIDQRRGALSKFIGYHLGPIRDQRHHFEKWVSSEQGIKTMAHLRSRINDREDKGMAGKPPKPATALG